MNQHNPLHHIDDDAPREGASVLVVQLTGFIDAGHTGEILAKHVLDAHEHEVVGRFDVDQLLDYRGRRPVMVFDKDRWTSYDEPALLLHRVRADDGTAFLLLTGPEPDYQWERMVTSVKQVAEMFGITLTASVHGIPMAVPHTRPLGVTSHGTNPALVGPQAAAFAQVQVPGSFTALLEYRLGQAGRDAVGMAVHVPHYLGQAEYAEAALVGLHQLSAVTGLAFDASALASAARDGLEQVSAELADNDEASQLVAALERQYDAFERGRDVPSLLAADAPVPSAEEIGAELEAFLKDVTADGPGPTEATGPV